MSSSSRSVAAISLVLCLAQIIFGGRGAEAASDPLQNEDIVRMATAGLSDEVILGAIERSPSDFDLSPSALIQLKEAGVSDLVIESMVKGSPSTAGQGSATSVPTVFGVYLQCEGEELTPLPEVPSAVRKGLSLAGAEGWGVDGLRSVTTTTASANCSILVFLQNVDTNLLRLSQLAFVEGMVAGEFNAAGTDPHFFQSLYGVQPTTPVNVNLWRRNRDLSLAVEPIAGQQWMFRVRPEGALAPGTYAVFFGDALQPISNVVSTQLYRSGTTYPFKVEGEALPVPNGALLDSVTNLLWTSNTSGSPVPWEGAQSYCRSLKLGVLGVWRLPSESELRGMLDTNNPSPCGDATCHFRLAISSDGPWVWTSETTSSGGWARKMTMESGQSRLALVNPFSRGQVLCVRSPPTHTPLAGG